MFKKQKFFLLIGQIIAAILIFASCASVKAEDFQDPGPILNDAFFPEDRIRAKDENRAENIFLGSAPYGAGFYDTSEFMIGSVSISIILPESDGTWDYSSENWTAAQEQQVLSEIKDGMTWWKDLNPEANLSFTYHFYSGRTDERAQTMYEPINRSEDDEGYWMDEIMTKFGYETGDYLYKCRSFINDQRDADKTDWAFVIFVVNDYNSSTHTFTDGSSAHATYGGPYVVMSYDQRYDITNMDSVTAHEVAHVFYALDQYPEAQQDCALRLGYLNYANQNSQYSSSGGSCKSDVPSIMRSLIDPFALKQVDKYARGQIGWADTDNDSALDAIDVAPSVIISSSSDVSSGKRYEGTAAVSPKENNNPYSITNHYYYYYPTNDITTSYIQKVQYRINAGSWKNAEATDGRFHSVSEDFSFIVPSSSGVDPCVQAKAVATSGNTKVSLLSGTISKQSIAAGAGAGAEPKVVIFNNQGKISKSFYAYKKSLKQGVKVAACDTDGNGKDEIITSLVSDQSANIKVFSKTGKKKNSFKVNTGGYNINLACGDTKGDGKAEIIVSFESVNSSEIKILNIKGKLIKKFYAFSGEFTAGVNIAAGDVNGDGKDEIIAASGIGNEPRVKFYKSSGKALSVSYLADEEEFTGGVNVASGDVDGNGEDDIITVPQTEKDSLVKMHHYSRGITLLDSFSAYSAGNSGAVVASGDVNGDGKAEIITAISKPRLQVKIFNESGTKIGNNIYPFKKVETSAYLAVGNF